MDTIFELEERRDRALTLARSIREAAWAGAENPDQAVELAGDTGKLADLLIQVLNGTISPGPGCEDKANPTRSHVCRLSPET